MLNKVLIEIKGTQRFGKETDSLELAALGTIRDNGSAYTIKYKEFQEPPEHPVDVTIRISKDCSSAEITRNGKTHSGIFIEKAKRNLCSYGSEYGSMLMGFYGKEIEAELDSGLNGKFFLAYDIDFNGTSASQHTVDITVSKTEN